jgi:hypothetical protein
MTHSTAVTVRLPVTSMAPTTSTGIDENPRFENKGANAVIKWANPVGKVDMMPLVLEKSSRDCVDRVSV